MVAVLTRKKIRVILADDHPVVRDGLAAMVNQQADMEVVAEAGDGDEAIDLYEQHQPDVMVLDLRMPKRDGVAVVQRVLEINPKARHPHHDHLRRRRGHLPVPEPGGEGLPAQGRPAAGDSVGHPRGERGPALYLLVGGGEGAAEDGQAQPDAA